ncbi:MAG TPA: ABC transporter substrate-binding protein [Gaiellaceae bacterium]|nr:ABC transporter substrate-binding protein [Gaiellaceae bacterium]
MARRIWLFALLLVAAGAALAAGSSGRAARGADGGTFRVISKVEDLDYVDPALAYAGTSWALLGASCAQLLNYPDRQRKQFDPVPEVAAGMPRSSNNARTFTFTLRRGYRFSDGTPVLASAYARAINRVLTLGPRGSQYGYPYMSDIVGADAVASGRRRSAAGVRADGYRLVVRLKQTAPDFPVRTAMPFFCPVPPNLPVDPEGIDAVPGSGPYYVSEYVRGKRAVLERNPYYSGGRPHRVDRFVVDVEPIRDQELLRKVEANEADWGPAAPPFYYDPALGLVEKYGINEGRLFVTPGLSMRAYSFNVARPLFRHNLALRRAVNFAVDRPALINEPFTPRGVPTDQYLPLGMPGYRKASIYPLDGPDLKQAKALARGHTRGGKAVLWTFDSPPAQAAAQIIKRNLRAIGLDVQVVGIPPGALGRRIASPNAAFDITFSPWLPDFIDPYQYVNVLLDSRFAPNPNFGRFSSPAYDALMRRAARLEGRARYAAYAALDARIARDAAPRVEIANDGATTFVSDRVGCVVVRPEFDLTAACLK